MRRAQSVRTQRGPRPSGIVDEMGLVGEADESPERQLLEAQRENDKLKNQISVLQAQLRARPPIEKVQELEKENANLELILQGMQRENERSAADLERKNNLQKMLEAELCQLLGENWRDKLEFPTTGPLTPSTPTSSTDAHKSSQALNSSTSSTKPKPPPKEDRASTINRLEQIRLLILGMESRMANREENLAKVVARAEEEGKKWEALAAAGSG